MQARLEAATRARQATEEEKAGLQRRLRKATDEVRRLSAQCQIAAEHAEAVVSDNLKLQERIDALEGCRREHTEARSGVRYTWRELGEQHTQNRPDWRRSEPSVALEQLEKKAGEENPQHNILFCRS